jgi:hypothetical protein
MEAQVNQNRAAHSNWLWGALLVVLGLIFLVNQSAAWDTDDMLPVIILAGVGTTFLIVYRNDRERRWPLIPASGCWAIAGGLLLDALLSPGGLFHVFRFYADEIIGAYVACVISAPFIYFFRQSRKLWLLIVPAIALAAAGGATLDAVLTQSRLFRFLDYYYDALMSTYVAAVLSAPFVYAYAHTRKPGWLILPFMALAIVGGVTLDLMISQGGLFYALDPGYYYYDALMGTYVAAVLSAPFVYAYAHTRKPGWLVLPFMALAIVGGVTLDLMISQGGPLYALDPGYYYYDALMGTYVAAVLSAPFVYAYVRTRKPGWLVLPFMALAIVGGVTLDLIISQGGPLYFLSPNSDEIMGAYVAAVFAAPFFYLYARDRRRWWALAAGGVLASISVGCLLAGLAWLIPVVLIGVGVFLLARQFVANRPQPVLTGPEADRPPAA